MALRSPIDVGPSWVNLYAAANPAITVGTQVIAQVLYSRSEVLFSDSTSAPTSTDGRVSAEMHSFHVNNTGDTGLWAYCSSAAQITLQEA